MLDHEKLDVYRCSIELVAAALPVVAAAPPRVSRAGRPAPPRRGLDPAQHCGGHRKGVATRSSELLRDPPRLITRMRSDSRRLRPRQPRDRHPPLQTALGAHRLHALQNVSLIAVNPSYTYTCTCTCTCTALGGGGGGAKEAGS